MAADITLITRNRVLAARAETTNGTPAANPLVTADCELFNVVHDPKITPEIPPNLRPSQQFSGQRITIPGGRKCRVSWRSEFFGKGSSGVPAWASVLFPSCGLALASSTYTPFTPSSSVGFPTCTVGFFQAGRYKQCAGTALNAVLRGKVGNPMYIEWAGEGVWQTPTSQAIPSSIIYPTAKPPRFAAASLSSFGSTNAIARVSEFSFDFGNKTYVREDQNAVDINTATLGTGHRAAIVTERVPMLRIDPESLPFSTLDLFAAHGAETTYDFSFHLGPGGDNNSMVFEAKNLQLNNPPQDKDREGVMADDLEFICTLGNSGSGEATDAEYSILFS